MVVKRLAVFRLSIPSRFHKKAENFRSGMKCRQGSVRYRNRKLLRCLRRILLRMFAFRLGRNQMRNLGFIANETVHAFLQYTIGLRDSFMLT